MEQDVAVVQQATRKRKATPQPAAARAKKARTGPAPKPSKAVRPPAAARAKKAKIKHVAVAPKPPKATRRSREQLVRDWNAGEQKGLAKCAFCQDVYTITNGHGCKASNFHAEEQKEQADGADRLYEGVDTKGIKMYLSRLLAPDKREFVGGWLNHAAEQQHRIVFLACVLLHAFVTHVLQTVTIANIDEHMHKKGRLLKIDQQTVKIALSLVSRAGADEEHKHPIAAYFREHFRQHMSTEMKASFGDAKGLSGTSLQYAARQLAANFGVMMQAQLWQSTAYWVRREMEEVTLPQVILAQALKTRFRRALFQWLHRQVMHEPKEQWARKPEAEIRQAWIQHMQKHVSMVDMETHLTPMWNDMYVRFIHPITQVLMPFELECGGGGAAAAEDDEDGDEDSCDNKKQAGRVFIACRRAEWLAAILKRLELLQQRAQARFEQAGSSNNKRNHHLPVFRLHHVFPLVGYVPGHLLCTEQLLHEMTYQYWKQHGTPEQKRVTKASLPLDAWMSLFNQSASSWKDQWVDEAGKVRARLRNKWHTDGLAVSLLETRNITKCRHVAPPVVAAGARKAQMPYIERESIETLRAQGVEAILVLDPGRCQLVDGKAMSLAQLDIRRIADDANEMEVDESVAERLQHQLAARNPHATRNPFATLIDQPNHQHANLTGDAKLQARAQRRKAAGITFRITQAEYKHVCKIKRHAQVRQRLEQVECGVQQHLFDVQAPSLKSSSPAAAAAYVRYLSEHNRFDALMTFYARPIFRHLRMESYSARQRWWVYIQDKIYRVLAQKGLNLQVPRFKRACLGGDDRCPRKVPDKFGPYCPPRHLTSRPRPLQQHQAVVRPRLLIVLGDGSFSHNSRGHLAMPSAKRLFDELTRLGELVRWVDEHRTSKCCSSCGDEMEPAYVTKHVERKVRQVTSKRSVRRSARLAQLSDRRRQEWQLPPPSTIAAAPAPNAPQRTPFRRRQCDEDGGGDERKSVARGTGEAGRLLKPWGLRYCSSCNRLWDRDQNADHNFISRIRWHLSQPASASPRVDGPAYLCRQMRDTGTTTITPLLSPEQEPART